MPSRAEIRAIIELLYKDVDGQHLSHSERTGELENERSFTYGEMLLESFVVLLNAVDPQPGEIFHDLGSGTGKPVLMAHLLYPFSRAIGVEFLPALHNQAQAIRERYDREIRPTLAEPRGEIRFHQGDMLQEDLSHTDVIFMHSTCFGETLMNGLQEKLRGCKPGTRIVAPSGLFYVPWLERRQEIEYPTAWDTVGTCYIYYKV